MLKKCTRIFLSAGMALSMTGCGGGGSDAETPQVSPTENQVPMVDAGPDQTVSEGVAVALDGTAADPDGSIVKYQWIQTGGRDLQSTGEFSSKLQFTAPEVASTESFAFVLEVTDNTGASAQDQITVNVTDANFSSGGTQAQAVWNGPIGGATVEVYALPASSTSPVLTATTTASDGSFAIPGGLDASSFYEVRISGGVDFDWNADGRIDDPPRQLGAQFRAVLSGAQASKFFRVSQATEAIAQRILPLILANYPTTSILIEQNRRSRWMLNRDINGSGTQDYADILVVEPGATESPFQDPISSGASEGMYQGRIDFSQFQSFTDNVFPGERPPGFYSSIAAYGERFILGTDSPSTDSVFDFVIGNSAREHAGPVMSIAEHVLGQEDVYDISMSGDIVVALTANGIRLFDASNALSPLGQVARPEISGIATSGDYVYAVTSAPPAGSSENFFIYNISDPSVPVEVSRIFVGNGARSVISNGTSAYVALGQSLVEINVLVPSLPLVMGSAPINDTSKELLIDGNMIAATGINHKISLIDTSLPGLPRKAAEIHRRADAISKNGNHFFAMTDNGTAVFDVSDLDNPAWAATLSGSADNSFNEFNDAVVVGDIALIASDVLLSRIDLSMAAAPALIGHGRIEPSVARNFDWARDVKVEGNRAYVMTIDFLYVFDVTEPSNPTEIGRLKLSKSIAFQCEDMVLHLSRAYLRCGSILIVDISDPRNPVQTGTSFILNGHVPDLAVVDNLLVLGGRSGDVITIYDLSIPDSPNPIGAFELPGRVFTNYQSVDGRRQYSVDQQSRQINIVGFDDPTQPALISSINVPFKPNALNVRDGIAAACHDSGFGIAAGLSFIDVSDQSSGQILSTVAFSGICDVVRRDGSYVYITSNSARDGVFIIDASDVLAPKAIGFMETREDPLECTISDGYLYVADRDAGLSVLRAAQPAD